ASSIVARSGTRGFGSRTSVDRLEGAMHLLILTDRYAPEARAAAYLSQELAESLAADGHNVTVLTKMPGRYMPDGQTMARRSEVVGGVQVVRVGGLGFLGRSLALRPLDHLLTALALMLRALLVPRPDAIVVYSPPLPLVLAAALHRWWRGIP